MDGVLLTGPDARLLFGEIFADADRHGPSHLPGPRTDRRRLPDLRRSADDYVALATADDGRSRLSTACSNDYWAPRYEPESAYSQYRELCW